MRLIRVLPFVLLAACQTTPRDPFTAALERSTDGDLLAALAFLDQVPPVHTSYAEARTLAAAVERRLRISSEMLVRGMTMRSEHRDDEAIRYFEQALAVWPRNPLAHEMIGATQARTEALRSAAPGVAGPGGEVATTAPVEDGGPAVADPPATGGPTDASPLVEPARSPVPPPAPASGGTATAQQLALAQHHLERGDADRALDLLDELRAREPQHPEVRRLTLRLLRNRALLRYGQGLLEEAVADWSRVVELEPGDQQAERYLRAARSELAERRRR